MAQNTTVALAADTWTQLTASDITALTFQNKSGAAILVVGAVDATPPNDEAGAIRYEPGEGERNAALTDLFPGISGANRVYAKSMSGAGSVMVSHA